MPTYEATINGETKTFEAANPQAAGAYVDAENRKGAKATPAASTGELPPAEPDPQIAAYTAAALGSKGPEAQQRAISRQEGEQLARGPDGGAGTFIHGGIQGASRGWNDEFAAAGEASGLPRWTSAIPGVGLARSAIGGARMALGDEGARKTYNTEVQKLRGLYEGQSKENPLAALGGEISGGLIGPQASPLIEGAVAGFGSGEGVAGSAAGAAVGGAFGRGAQAIGEHVIAPAWQTAKRIYQGPERAAVSDVADVLQRDLQRMTPEQRAQWQADRQFTPQSGQHQVQTLADVGGENTKTLLRSTANISPDAKALYQETLQGRYDSQAERFGGWWGNVTGHPDAVVRRQALNEAATAANAPRYRRAYEAGQSVMTPQLETLTGSHQVRQAIRDATQKSTDRAALRGERSTLRNPFVEGPDGTLRLPEGVTPSLEFWDQVQRNLRSQAEDLPRGSQDRGTLEQLRNRLNSHLDEAVPEFNEARRGAAAFFGQEDALEAGRTFLNHPRASSTEARQALDRMSQAERELFRDGLSEDVSNMVRAMPPGQDVGKVLQSQEMRSRLVAGLGRDRADDLQRYLRVERLQTQVKNALGNSTTAQQLLATGAVGAGVGWAMGYDPLSAGGIAAGAGALLRGGNNRLNAAAANRISQLLMSQDPDDLRQVARAMRNNPAVREALEFASNKVSSVLGQQAGAAVSMEQY